MSTRSPLLKPFLALGLLLLASTSFALAKEQAPGLSLDNNEWIIFDSETFYPVVDNLHATLNLAYREYNNKQYDKSILNLKDGANFLRHQAGELPDHLAYKSRGAASKLDSVARKVKNGKTNKKEVQLAIERAYLADWAPQWVAAEEEVAIDLLSRPGQQMAEALLNFKQKKYEEAAFDLRRAAAYMEVTRGAGSESRELRRLAHQLTAADQSKPDLKAFESSLIEVSRAYADNEMDRAVRADDTTRMKAHLRAGVASAKNVQNLEQGHRGSPKLQQAIESAEKALKKDAEMAREELVKSARAIREAL